MSIENIVFLLITLILYSYCFYPIVLFIISRYVQRIHQSELRAEDSNDNHHLSVAVVISAYNEEKHIVNTLHKLLQQDYPSENIKIYIGSDGSTDNTVKLIKQLPDNRIVLFDFSVNRGKVSVLNEILSQITESVVVFTDANAAFRLNALSHLIKHFSVPEVAGVCGELNLIKAATGDNYDNVYWRIERFLKYHESKVNGFLGANGAIYAIRREYFQPLPSDTIIDDFTLFMKIALNGYKTVYEADAIADEEMVASMSGEYGRRVRIGAGNYQAFFRLKSALHAKQGIRAFTYLSHKVLRWFTPHFLLLIFILNLLLLDQYSFVLLFIIQVILYTVCFVVIKYFKNYSLPTLISLPVFFINMNLALGHGFIDYTFREIKGNWKRTER
jgi:cellulose synthase/poly-beta-1,6-N-acetylglucosamine synthase-like glycosyltransferase